MKKYFYCIVIAASLMASFSSCAKNGYGCRGNSRIMTRVR
jgi:hypothetical protein